MHPERCWIGIDGTRTGWVVAVVTDRARLGLQHISTLSKLWELIVLYGHPQAIGIDIPIGLLEHAERGGRGCDREARRILSAAKRKMKEDGRSSVPFVGPSSIFTPPTRPALSIFAKGGSHSCVSAANSASGKQGSEVGLGLSIQTYHIMGKILEADELLTKGDATSACLAGIPTFECHPELAFLALGQRAKGVSSRPNMASTLAYGGALLSKKHVLGRQQRLELLGRHAQVSLSDLRYLTRDGHQQKIRMAAAKEKLGAKQTWHIRGDPHDDKDTWVGVAADDVLDALVCAVSAGDFSQGKTIRIGEDDGPLTDSRGLPMLIQV